MTNEILALCVELGISEEDLRDLLLTASTEEMKELVKRYEYLPALIEKNAPPQEFFVSLPGTMASRREKVAAAYQARLDSAPMQCDKQQTEQNESDNTTPVLSQTTSDELSTRERKMRPRTRYRCTLVRNQVRAGLIGYTDAIRAIGLDHDSYQECEHQKQFLSNDEMAIYLNEKTEDEAWEDEARGYNAL